MFDSPTETHFAVIITSAFVLLLVFIIILSAYLFHRRRKREQEQFWRELLKTRLEIQEQTLQHLSRELHDNLGQMASLVKINLNTLNWEYPDRAKAKIEETKELTRQLIGDLKAISQQLGGDRLQRLGLEKTILADIDRINQSGIMTASLIREGSIPDLPSETAIILYRMAQEIMNNALKHSEAQNLYLTLWADGKILKLACTDDGKGFDAEAAGLSTGAGLSNLRYRSRMIQATVDIHSQPSNGTEVTITLPYA